MKTFKRYLRRSGRIAMAVVLGVGIIAPSVLSGSVSAAQMTSRKVTLNSNLPNTVTTDANGTGYGAGTYYNGAQTTHTFNWNEPSTTAVKGIAIMYCSDSPLPQTTCTAPTGLLTNATTAAALATAPTGFGNNSFSVDTTVAGNTGYFATGQCSGGAAPYRQNCVMLTNASGAANTANAAITLALGNATNGWIKNPTNTGTYYVRIATFSDTAMTSVIDQGSVTFTIQNGLEIDSAVQESLNFSVGTAVPAPGSTCAAATGTGPVGLGTLSGSAYLLSTTVPSYNSSYWRISTNASNGVAVYYRGNALKNSSGVALATSTTPWTPTGGVERFGLTVDSSDGSYSMTNLAPQAPYNSATTFAFDTTSTTLGTPALLASVSAGTTVNCDTAAIKYVGSASTTTQPGIYKTNIVYYAVPTY